jgi:hypothetical protein
MAPERKASDVIIEKLDKSLCKIENNLSSKLEKVEDRLHQIEIISARHEMSLTEHMRRTALAEASIEKVDAAAKSRADKLDEIIKILRERQDNMEKFQNRVMGAVVVLTPIATWALNHFTK